MLLSCILSIHSRLYGDVFKRSERVLNTFADRSKSTGVLLAGTKGSGKSLLSKYICVEANKQGMPVILVNEPFGGDGFNQFIQLIIQSQPTVLFFDEFEKVYDEDEGEQARLLTLLDGTYEGKCLFLFTCNNIYHIDEHMLNRPGRVFYKFDYSGLDEETITQYCNDNLNNIKELDNILGLSKMMNSLNFDSLSAIVAEMNRYDETLEDVLKVLNIDFTKYNARTKYSLNVLLKDYLLSSNHRLEFNPFVSYEAIWLKNMEEITYQNSEEVIADKEINFSKENIRKYDKLTGAITYEVDDEDYGLLTLVATPIVDSVFTFGNLL